MFKKTLRIAAAALAITAGTTTISTPEAKAGVSINLGFGGWGGYGGYGGWGGHYRSRYYGHRHYRYRYYRGHH